jgi:PAS domain S-box-containing protein
MTFVISWRRDKGAYQSPSGARARTTEGDPASRLAQYAMERGSMGWSSMFWATFKRSQNPMALLDDRRSCVEVNGAMVRATGRGRKALVGVPAWTFVKEGPRATQREWRAMIEGGDFLGETELVAADGTVLGVHYAAHPATVGGRRLMLFVCLEVARHGRHRRANRENGERTVSLSAREQEIVHLVALGYTSHEIADELHIAHDTVRTHVRNAQTKLGARSRAQLVAIALADGHNSGARN